MKHPLTVDLVIIKSALQLKNAADWIQHHAGHPCIACVFWQKSTQQGLQRALEQYNTLFKELLFFKESKDEKEIIENCVRLIRQTAEYRVHDFVYANFDKWAVQIIKDNVPHQQDVVIDDGVGSIGYYYRFWRKGDSHRLHQSWKKQVRIYYWAVLRHRLKFPRRLTFGDNGTIFSRFNFDDPRFLAQQKEKPLMDYHGQASKVLFVGKPLVKQHRISMERYIYYLQQIMAQNPGFTFAYKPHPSELPSHLKLLQQADINVIENSLLCAEDYFVAHDFGSCIGFWSTVLVKLKERTPQAQIYYIKPSATHWKRPVKELDSIYTYLDDSGIPSLELDKLQLPVSPVRETLVD